MTCFLYLDYGGSTQVFGGYALERATFITKVLDTLEVTSWEKLPGTILRVRQDDTKVHAIGHFIEDVWFTPAGISNEAHPHHLGETCTFK